jgi:hypothetical protein
MPIITYKPVTKSDFDNKLNETLSALTGIRSQTDNLDVLLSSRASEATLSTRASEATLAGIKTQTDKLTFDTNNRLAIQNPPNLDVALTSLARLERWGKDIEPFWVHAAEVTAPAAGTALVSRTVTAGKQGFIYGFLITAQEANDFRINWTSTTARSIRITYNAAGSVESIDATPLNQGLPADGGSTITITNVNAGGSGKVYQARLLYAEV